MSIQNLDDQYPAAPDSHGPRYPSPGHCPACGERFWQLVDRPRNCLNCRYGYGGAPNGE